MNKGKSKLYIKLDGFKKISGHVQSKARSMGVLSKIAMLFISGRFIIALVLIVIAAAWANDNIRKRGVEPKCWFSMTGDTAVAKGVITNIEFISLGVKNRHDYTILYTYTVDGKTYQGTSYQVGLIYRKNEAVDVTYSVKDPSCSCGVGMKCPAEDAMFTIIFGGVLLLIAIFLAQGGVRRIFKTIWIIEYGSVANAAVRNITRTTRMIWSYRTVMSVTRWDVNIEFKDSNGKTVGFNAISPTEEYINKGDSISVVFDPGIPEHALPIDALPFFVKTDPGLR